MRIFLDTADIEEIRQAARWGIVSGVTTNPTLMARAGAASFKDTVTEIAALIPGPISAEVTAREAEAMLEQAREIASWAENVVIKVPIDAEGIRATSLMANEGIKVNNTLCFSVNQALLAALAGATFVSPFVGRLDDAGHDGMEVVADIVDIFDRYDFTTQVLAASIRHPRHVVVAAQVGAHIATVPYRVLTQMVRHPLTDVGIARFLEDWQQAGLG